MPLVSLRVAPWLAPRSITRRSPRHCGDTTLAVLQTHDWLRSVALTERVLVMLCSHHAAPNTLGDRMPLTRAAIRRFACCVRVGSWSALLLVACVTRAAPPLQRSARHATVIGEFSDDYSGRFSISDTLWFQRPRNRFRIVEWHDDEQFLIAQNAPDDPSAPNLWTRIDWMTLDDMPPFAWGFCLTAYRAPTRLAARETRAADRAAPRTGCNGFPFTRMQQMIGTEQ